MAAQNEFFHRILPEIRDPLEMKEKSVFTMAETLEMAESHVGRTPSITHQKVPPIQMAGVLGTRESI